MVLTNPLVSDRMRTLTSLKQFGIFASEKTSSHTNQLTMNVKIDTKEIFYVISITEEKLTANMSVELIKRVTEKQKEANKSIILDFTALAEIDKEAIDLLVKWHENIYQDKKSLVIFGLSNPVKSALDEAGLLELVNHTPTESEAWDIVQMEEIVRELDTDFE